MRSDKKPEHSIVPDAATDFAAFKQGLERMASEVRSDRLSLATIVEGLTVLESRRSDNSAEGDEALMRAVGLVMRSGRDAALVTIASQKSGQNVGADMGAIRGALDHAVLMIAWHGEAEGARQAKAFLGRMVRLAKEYRERADVTFAESVIGALRSLSHAVLVGGRGVRFPKYELIARAVLRNNSAQLNFEKQVAALASILPERLAPYTCDSGYRPGVDLREVARVVLKAGGVDPYNAFDAPAKMRETRLREKLGKKAPAKRRQPRTAKRKP